MKTVEVQDLKFPLSSLYEDQPRKDYRPSPPMLTNVAEQEYSLYLGEGHIKGKLGINGMFTVREINISGEGSGTLFHNALKPALLKSTGFIQLKLAWETSETETVTVRDGIYDSAIVDF